MKTKLNGFVFICPHVTPNLQLACLHETQKADILNNDFTDQESGQICI